MWQDRMGWSQFARILAMILYKQLQREIGRKSLKGVEELDLWIKAMKLELMAS